MKIYPPNPCSLPFGYQQDGFTADDIRKGIHWLYTDVTCEECGHVQDLAMAGSIDNGKCIRCGGRTS